MPPKEKSKQIFLLVLLVAGISFLHYFTQQSRHHYHIFYRELYFLPLILAGFWFGLRGALATSIATTAIYLPLTLIRWEGFSPEDFDKILEIGLFNIVAAVSGALRDREKAREKEKLEGIMAMAGSVAHEMNTPLFSALGTAQLLQEELESETENYDDLQTIIGSLKEMNRLIKKIARIDRIEIKDYVGSTRIMDIEKASKKTMP